MPASAGGSQASIVPNHVVARKTRGPGAINNLPGTTLIGSEQNGHHQQAIVSAGFEPCWCAREHTAIGTKLKVRLRVLGA